MNFSEINNVVKLRPKYLPPYAGQFLEMWTRSRDNVNTHAGVYINGSGIVFFAYVDHTEISVMPVCSI